MRGAESYFCFPEIVEATCLAITDAPAAFGWTRSGNIACLSLNAEYRSITLQPLFLATSSSLGMTSSFITLSVIPQRPG